MSLTNLTGQLVQIAVPGTNATIPAAEVDGKPFVPIKPMCEAIGIDVDGQRRKLAEAEWAVTELISATGSDGKSYQMVALDADHLPMWLATIQTNRIAEEARPVLIAFQREAAAALRDYFYRGGAINPSATEDQLERIARQAGAQAAVLQALKGIVDPKHLEAKGRIVLARALGETPEIDPASVPLYVSDYLKSKNLSSDMIAAKSSGFGKRLKGLYVSERGDEPKKAYQNLPNGTVREVYAYTQADKGLFDQVWNRHYAGVTKAVSA
ncbi:phage antirepressor N-terminal domain-containing protein [Rhodococcus pyridinivorans]|uniref:Phage antirepressor N-terminal domain-containing protein n=1 Tax=Rhodococcus pyridinivorans TaxID=103816 RepID=A0A7M2XIE6_9NOCA|nr:phage antirepressor N-terminal domain-containing protein [Rhodococcus pyridinivorans]QOV97183.1 phage antirepressor N-terminal domain-containing protein [Rhodococcus pyridinivorans]